AGRARAGAAARAGATARARAASGAGAAAAAGDQAPQRGDGRRRPVRLRSMGLDALVRVALEGDQGTDVVVDTDGPRRRGAADPGLLDDIVGGAGGAGARRAAPQDR